MLKYDVIIAGGGLAGSLCAVAIARSWPSAKIAIFESGPKLGGTHRWSFFGTDLDGAGHPFIAGLSMLKWPKYEVKFPKYTRQFENSYFSFTDADLAAWVGREVPHLAFHPNSVVTSISDQMLTCGDEHEFEAQAVIDARGWRGSAIAQTSEVAYQKFVGFLVDARDHGITMPTIMDATVQQVDGYRFIYTLPINADSLFIEDTYYSNSPELDIEKVTGRLASKLLADGVPWTLRTVETGILPVILANKNMPLLLPHEAIPVGVRAGLFHHVTSYSLPHAVSTALWLAPRIRNGSTSLISDYSARLQTEWRNQSFGRLLNKMLFRNSTFEQRRTIMSRFYGLNEPLIERFYASRLTLGDKLRILAGRPPIPISQAVRAITK